MTWHGKGHLDKGRQLSVQLRRSWCPEVRSIEALVLGSHLRPRPSRPPHPVRGKVRGGLPVRQRQWPDTPWRDDENSHGWLTEPGIPLMTERLNGWLQRPRTACYCAY